MEMEQRDMWSSFETRERRICTCNWMRKTYVLEHIEHHLFSTKDYHWDQWFFEYLFIFLVLTYENSNGCEKEDKRRESVFFRMNEIAKNWQQSVNVWNYWTWIRILYRHRTSNVKREYTYAISVDIWRREQELFRFFRSNLCLSQYFKQAEKITVYAWTEKNGLFPNRQTHI